MFSEDITKELSAKLDPAHVKERTQGNFKLSYIEGWHAIAEANRIFGYGDWERETVACDCVNSAPRTIGTGQYQKDGFGVTYTAKVRVTMQGVRREGTGAGHGIDADLGKAHESAIKEAETDAMKRALMTFGNPFGLALYDKTQAGVGSNEPEKPNYNTQNNLINQINKIKEKHTAVSWLDEHQKEIDALPEEQKDTVMGQYESVLAHIEAGIEVPMAHKFKNTAESDSWCIGFVKQLNDCQTPLAVNNLAFTNKPFIDGILGQLDGKKNRVIMQEMIDAKRNSFDLTGAG